MRMDIILQLSEHGELNQSQLMSYCRLNNVQHKPIIDELVEKGLIVKYEEPWGDQNKIIKYRVSEKGRVIAKIIIVMALSFVIIVPIIAYIGVLSQTTAGVGKFIPIVGGAVFLAWLGVGIRQW